MIHSLSGGVLGDGGVYTFAKVRVEETPCWYLAPRGVKAGSRVRVPFGRGTAEGTVERVEACTPHTAPVPMNRAREILEILS